MTVTTNANNEPSGRFRRGTMEQRLMLETDLPADCKSPIGAATRRTMRAARVLAYRPCRPVAGATLSFLFITFSLRRRLHSCCESRRPSC